MPKVNGKRRYDASGRRERAQQTRLSILRAAQNLFEDRGYRPTTVTAVAQCGGVAPESVYKIFGTKAGLAKAVFDYTIAGDDDPVPVIERSETKAIFAEPDVRKKITMYADQMAARQVRSARIQLMLRDGRHGQEDLEEIWRRLVDERLNGMTMLGRHLLDTGQLRPGIELDEVRDVLWTYIAVDLYELLVLSRGWTVERYAQWIARAIIAALT
ncbi:TetR/AcrR family transcriptional regulator [Rhodococcus sp. HM1]|nr:helix-turn-helix domain-containing protein [Rhodococcus sp. HM1]MCK8673757.1 TetR/AcrR family transcriptional regulator [Rhodococcus sp. HM1]